MTGKLRSVLPSTWLLLAFLAAGIIHTATHLDYPIIRNSLIYAGIVEAIGEYGILSNQVGEHAHEKSLGFSILAWPLTRLLGLATGLKTLSVIATSLWAFCTLVFLRQVIGPKKAGREKIICLALTITMFNPLAIYQFSSAYPDTLFAALFLAAVLFMDKSLSDKAHSIDGLVWALALLGAVWIKHHGLLLLPVGLLFLAFRWRNISAQWQTGRVIFWSWVLPLVVALGVLGLAQSGNVPTFNLARDQDSFLRGFSLAQVVRQGSEGLAAWILLSFSVLLALPLLSRFRHHLFRVQPEWLLVGGIFIVTLLIYNGTGYNMRYFLAISPLFAIGFAVLLCDLSRPGQTLWFSVYLLINAGTTLYYNIPAVHRVAWPIVPLPFVDNLRLTAQQYAERRNLHLIRKYAPSHDNTLVYLSRYYGDGTFDIWQKTGDLPPDLKILNAKYWKHEMIQSHGIRRAVIYEYVATGPEQHYLWLDKEIQKKLTKRNNRLYLLKLDEDRQGKTGAADK